MNNCLFCKEFKNKDFIFQNSFFYLRWDNFPVSPGHCEIVPYKHVDKLENLNPAELIDLKLMIPKVKQIIINTNFKELYNMMLDNPINDNSKKFLEKMLEKIDKVGNNIVGYNFGINEGEYAGQTIPHLHIHIIPRYERDVEDPVGGIRHMIPGMGNYRNINF
jgi:diadenosine tetraphosphate (Ap4A) HIT family hydrolase